MAYFLNDDQDMIQVGSAFVDSKPNTSSANTAYGIVNSTNGIRKIGDTEYRRYTVKSVDGDVTVNLDASKPANVLTERDIVKFDQTTDDCYDTINDFEILVNATTTTTGVGNGGNEKYSATPGTDTWTLGAVNSYKDNTLSYYTATSRANSTTDFFAGVAGDGTDAATYTYSITVDKDVEVYYFNLDGKKVGDNINVTSFDKTTGFPNVLFHTDSTDGIVDVIIVETQGDYTMEDNRVSANASSLTFGKIVAYQVTAPTVSNPYLTGATVTVTPSIDYATDYEMGTTVKFTVSITGGATTTAGTVTVTFGTNFTAGSLNTTTGTNCSAGYNAGTGVLTITVPAGGGACSGTFEVTSTLSGAVTPTLA